MSKKTKLDYVKNFVMILLGSFIYAVGYRFFIYPNGVVPGGLTGIATILNHVLGLPVGVMTIVMNIPLFIIAGKKFGVDFFVGSLIGMLTNSVFIDLLSLVDFVATNDHLLGAVFGGVIKGLGMGIIYTASASTGGSDIMAKILRHKYQHINFGQFLMMMDLAIIGTYAAIFNSANSAMYSLICMFIGTRVIDFILYGAVNTRVCYIITDREEAVKDEILNGLHRGVTLLHGEGAWSHTEKNVILCVIKSRQIVEIKRIVKSIDENAFMIVSDSREVFGKGFSYIGADN